MISIFHHVVGLNTLLETFGYSMAGILVMIFRAIRKYAKKINAKIMAIETSNLALLHWHIYNTCTAMIEREYSTVEELDNLQYFWQAYEALGGNGTGELLYEQARKLPIKDQ
ncbi:hypothetical protein [Enterococcus sp. DIV0240a]|uniref:hypothetical protein n=1 Tax=Enterococcus sp. DIV0240a TaxID=2774651 RepID=UPI003D2A2E4C